MSLFKHTPPPHEPINVNEQHAAERKAHANVYTRFNERAAVWLTIIFSTMELFWLVDIFMAVWIAGNSIGIWHFDPMPYPLLLMIINIPQLPLLPLLAIGQAVLSRKQTLQADEQFNTTNKTFEDILQVMQHLNAQDDELIKQTNILLDLIQHAKGVQS